MNTLKIEKVFRVFLGFWILGFVYPQFYMFAISASLEISFAMISYYFLVYLGFLLFTIFLIWKFQNPWVKLAAIPVFVFAAYISFRLLQEDYWILNPAQFIWNLIISVAAVVNVLYFLVVVWIELYKNLKIKKIEVFKAQFRVYEKVTLIIFVLWVPMITWSYFGFSQTYEVKDPKQTEFSVSFWGVPSAGFNLEAYNNSLVQQELLLYQRLNSTFIYGLNWRYLADPVFRNSCAQAMIYLSNYGIHFMIDTSVVFPWYNQSGEEWIWAYDFVTYYYTEFVNRTIDAIMDWVDEYNFTNFRGITLDIEGPNYTNASFPKSRDAYELGKKSFNNKFAEFRARFPGKEINGISMEQIMYDVLDGDNDLQIVQRTVDYTLDLNMFGYMTYHTGGASISSSSYRYVMQMKQGIRAHGLRFQPWVGWWSDPSGLNDPNVIENPVVYNQSIEHYKIAKSFGVKEVVLAPVRNFLGRNLTEGIQRLQQLVDIKENGFETFSINIFQDPRFFSDFPLWWKKIHPNNWILLAAIFEDMMMGTPFQGFLISHIIVSILGAVLVFYLLRRFEQRS